MVSGLQHGLLENMIVVRYLTASRFPEGIGYDVGGSNIRGIRAFGVEIVVDRRVRLSEMARQPVQLGDSLERGAQKPREPTATASISVTRRLRESLSLKRFMYSGSISVIGSTSISLYVRSASCQLCGE